MYYCKFLDREAGPFTREEIYTLIREGQLQKQSLITSEGETKAAEEWPEFKILFIAVNKTAPIETPHNPNSFQKALQTNWDPLKYLKYITDLQFIRKLGILSIALGVCLLLVSIISIGCILLGGTAKEGISKTLDENLALFVIYLVHSLFVLASTGMVMGSCIRNIFRFPKPTILRMALFGLAMIIPSIIFIMLLSNNTGTLWDIIFLVMELGFYIPYTVFLGLSFFLFKNLSPEKIQNQDLLQDNPQSDSSKHQNNLFLKIFKGLVFTYILFGVLIVHSDFNEMTKDHTRKTGTFDFSDTQQQDTNAFLYNLVFVPVSGIIQVIALRDLYKSPKKSIGKLALLGLAMIIVNFVVCYIIDFGGFVPEPFLYVFLFIPYTYFMGITALLLRE